MARSRLVMWCCAMPRARQVIRCLALVTALLCAPAAAHAEDLTLGTGAYTFDTSALTISGPGVNATGFADGTIAVFAFEDITIPDTAALTIQGQRPLSLRASDTLSIAGPIDLRGSDASGGVGGAGGAGGGAGGDALPGPNPGVGLGAGGAPANAVSGGGGGGHVGDGGGGASAILDQLGALVAAPGFGGAPGTTNVDISSPLQGGSGGGSGSSGAGGGGGGGAVELVGATVALDEFAVTNGGGDGADSPNDASGGGGAGSSGMVRIIADTLTGQFSSVELGADGGAGGAAGGGGGGGLVAVLASAWAQPASFQFHIEGASNGQGDVPGAVFPGPGLIHITTSGFPTVAARLDELARALRRLEGLDGLVALEASRDDPPRLCAELHDLIFDLVDAQILPPPETTALIVELRTRLACGALIEDDGGGGYGAELLPERKPEQAPATQTATVLQQIVREHTVIQELAPAPNAVTVTPTLSAAGTRAVVTKATVKNAVRKAKAAKKRAKAKKRKRARARSGKRARARSARPRARRAG